MNTILITGGSGLIGNAIKLISDDYKGYNFIYSSSKECDLKDYNATYKYIEAINPIYVIHLAANVGGLYKNLNNKVQMFEDNISINNNVIKACHKNNIEFWLSIFLFERSGNKKALKLFETTLSFPANCCGIE